MSADIYQVGAFRSTRPVEQQQNQQQHHHTQQEQASMSFDHAQTNSVICTLLSNLQAKHSDTSVKMFASRAMKPKLSLSVVTSAPQPTSTAARPALSLSMRSPITPTAMTPLRSPISTTTPILPMANMTQSPMPMSPLPQSPTARNTKINARGFSTIAQQPTYAYPNFASSRSILKKSESNTSRRRVAQLQFSDDNVVYSVTPIEDPDYYGGYKKMSKDERRWMVRA